MSLRSVYFQFICVLPFLGDFRTLFGCFSDFGALFSNFSVVHDCDCTTFLWLRSLFSNLVLLCCWAWLWEKKVMFMLCMSVLPYPPDFRTFFSVFVTFVFCFLMSYICFTVFLFSVVRFGCEKSKLYFCTHVWVWLREVEP